MAKPLLNCAQIDPRPETSGCERSSEFVQPEIVFIQLPAVCDSF
jgi:hypothetical protein